MNKKDYLLYNASNNDLTNTYYIKNVITNKINIYCIGPIKKGDYVTTSSLKGAGMISAIKDTAFGISLTDKKEYEIGLIQIKLLEH